MWGDGFGTTVKIEICFGLGRAVRAGLGTPILIPLYALIVFVLLFQKAFRTKYMSIVAIYLNVRPHRYKKTLGAQVSNTCGSK